MIRLTDIITDYTLRMLFGWYAGVWILLAYIAGSVPFGWIIARSAGVDITKHGSGNIGGTNVWRTLGWKSGIATLLLDTVKGLLPVVALRLCMPRMESGYIPAGWEHALPMLVAIFAVLGHTFTPWLKLKGGKGIATGLGVIIALYQWWVLPVLAIFGVVLLTTRFVSLSSLMTAMFLFLFSISIDSIRWLWPFSTLALILVIWTHRANIGRLVTGTESQIGRKKVPAPTDPGSSGEDQAETANSDS